MNDLTPKQEVLNYFENKPKIHFSKKQQFIPKHIHEHLMLNQVQTELGLQTEYVNQFTSDCGNAVEDVYKQYGLPYPLYDYQVAWVNAFADKDVSGMYFEVGAGKTSTATVAALYHQLQDKKLNPNHKRHTIVLMPPILILQWYNWLNSIKGVGEVLMYRGTPKARQNMDLSADWVLMSMDIFKRDFERIYEFYEDKDCTVIIDEAVCIKNPNTTNHKCVWAFQNLDRKHLDPSKPKKVIDHSKMHPKHAPENILQAVVDYQLSFSTMANMMREKANETK